MRFVPAAKAERSAPCPAGAQAFSGHVGNPLVTEKIPAMPRSTAHEVNGSTKIYDLMPAPDHFPYAAERTQRPTEETPDHDLPNHTNPLAYTPLTPDSGNPIKDLIKRHYKRETPSPDLRESILHLIQKG